MDPETGTVRYKKDKKFYFTDPILYWISLEWAGHPVPSQSAEKMAEQVAHEFLARRAKRLGYLSSPKGEVDFFDPKRWAIEVKWSKAPKNLSRAYLDLLIPVKMVWSQSNFIQELPRKWD
jgi:predicted AAA+ superfamily ATPase